MEGVNFLPVEVISRQADKKLQRQLRAILRAVCVLVFFFIFAESGYFAFSYLTADTTIPESLQAEFLQAQRQKAHMGNSLELMRRAAREDRRVLERVDKLSQLKPESVRFLKVDISDSGSGVIEGYGSNAALFNQYTDRINQEGELFSKAVVERIAAGTGAQEPVKTFTIRVQ